MGSIAQAGVLCLMRVGLLRVTLPFPRRERASKQRQRGGLFPGEPRLQRVARPLTRLDNLGACLPDYSFSWS